MLIKIKAPKKTWYSVFNNETFEVIEGYTSAQGPALKVVSEGNKLNYVLQKHVIWGVCRGDNCDNCDRCSTRFKCWTSYWK